MSVAAIAKRLSAITNGCADSKPILVAVDADPQRIANTSPAITVPAWVDRGFLNMHKNSEAKGRQTFAFPKNGRPRTVAQHPAKGRPHTAPSIPPHNRSEEHTSELQSREN